MHRTTLLCPKLRLELLDEAANYHFKRPSRTRAENREMVMALALEINMVLWLMIGCATAETVQLVEHLY